MSVIKRFKDYILIEATYKSPELHRHMASHIIISLGKEMEWVVEEEKVSCRGICIGTDVFHTGVLPEEGALVFLFPQISRYTKSLNQRYLHEQRYAIIEESVIDGILNVYTRNQRQIGADAEELLQACGLIKQEEVSYDSRVAQVLAYLEQVDSILPDTMEKLSELTYLSKSRLAHLFKEETGMTLHSYLAYQKLEKIHKFLNQGSSITTSSMMAGFDSPSHCAATCKRMYGIAIRDVYKTLATK